MYEFKTKPFEHQSKAFYATRDESYKAILWEMGLGKSWLVINTTSYLYETNKIDAFLILAPNGVAANWITQEIPKHLPDRINYEALVWRSGKTNKHELQKLIQTKNLAIFAVNVEAVSRAANCRKFLEKFLETRRALIVLDESIVIKSPSAAITKTLIALGRRAPYKRICSGVPITQGPLDLYGQFQFLKEGILTYNSFYAFKHAFADWNPRINHKTNVKFEELVGYKNQDKLIQLCAPYTLRATKEECLDLPPKLYERRPFELAKEQRELYNKLRDQYVAELSEMEHVSISHALTRMLRLQQVTSGFWPATDQAEPCPNCDTVGCPRCDDLGYIVNHTPLRALPTNSRLTALLTVTNEIPKDRQIIIWCRFRRDVETIQQALTSEHTAVYYGGASPQERTETLERFKNGTRYFVGTARAGGRGLTLTEASYVIYFSHDFSYETRAQSEDRAHRIGQTKPVTYIDLVAEDTVDERLMEVVSQKRDLASLFDKSQTFLFTSS